MFNGLQKKWNVSGGRLLLILLTFALGGSLTGYAGRKVLNRLDIENSLIYVLAYIAVMTLIWPLMVLLVSVFTGQFSFFRTYLARMGSRLRRSKKNSTT